MTEGSIYIDDSGNPGSNSNSDFLPESRVSWTAVIIPPDVAHDVSATMEIFLDGVKQEFGADELHFTDIFSGRGPWRQVSVPRRIEIFGLMKDVFRHFALPVIHQTVSESTINDHQDVFSRLSKKPGVWWDIQKISHLGLLFLCSKISSNLLELHTQNPDTFRLPLPAYVDEGLAKEGTSIDLPNWGNVFKEQKIEFKNSKDIVGIQIADFAAFAITRSQWLMAQQRSGAPIQRGDLEFLKTTSDLNILNLPKISFDCSDLSKESFEKVLSRDRRQKGLSARPKKKPLTRTSCMCNCCTSRSRKHSMPRILDGFS